MNSEIVIKITSQGVTQSSAIASHQESDIPVPDPEMGVSIQEIATSADTVPSPEDNLGFLGESAASPPSPVSGDLSAMDADGGSLPEPVSLGEIEKLGSSSVKSASVSDDTKPPEPVD